VTATQYAGLYADAGGGHAMIVYAVTDEDC
jgi:hypothetical protein